MCPSIFPSQSLSLSLSLSLLHHHHHHSTRSQSSHLAGREQRARAHAMQRDNLLVFRLRRLVTAAITTAIAAAASATAASSMCAERTSSMRRVHERIKLIARRFSKKRNCKGSTRIKNSESDGDARARHCRDDEIRRAKCAHSSDGIADRVASGTD